MKLIELDLKCFLALKSFDILNHNHYIFGSLFM